MINDIVDQIKSNFKDKSWFYDCLTDGKIVYIYTKKLVEFPSQYKGVDVKVISVCKQIKN